MLQQNVLPFWKELFVIFKMAPNENTHYITRVTGAYIRPFLYTEVFIPPVYEVYRGYIAFAFSVIMSVCL